MRTARPFSLYFRAVDKVNQDIVALNYGPLVLVADTMTQFIGNAAEPSAWIHPAASKLATLSPTKVM